MDKQEKGRETDIIERLRAPLPQVGDTVFKALDARRDIKVRAGWLPAQHQWLPYQTGYMDAADILVKHYDHRSPSTNSLVYPIVFLCRHHLELVLKELIRDSEGLRQEPFTHWDSHDLTQMWPPIRDVVKLVWPGVPKDRLKAVGTCIREMNAHDPRSYAWRYPVDKEGGANLGALFRFDLPNFREVMHRLCNFFDLVYEAVHRYHEARSSVY